MTSRVPFAAYDRAALVPSVVHIGPGVFHRAHQAVYADDVLCTGARTGAIWGISLRSREARDALAPAGFVYQVIERSSGEAGDARASVRPVGSVLGIDVIEGDPESALARLVDPAVTVVTTTVTEHGYCAVGPGGSLDVSRPEIIHDLATPHAPSSLPGLLLEALVRRRAAGTAPFTVACCDNLPTNGRAVARVVTDLAECRDAALAEWVRHDVAFPSSMVDRMVPTTSDDDRALVHRLGFTDAWPVVTEPFSQWILEDVFPSGRPPWERVGVDFVADVAPYEQVKLRTLNAAHSALAYWGLLAGHRYVWQAAADPVLRDATWDLLIDEVLPTLTPPPGWDLVAYVRQVLDRFANRALPYATAKVAGDGSQKLPVRLVPTVLARLASGAPARRCSQVLAAWAACVAGPRASALGVVDPALVSSAAGPLLPGRAPRTPAPEDVARALLGLPGFLAADRPGQQHFVAEVARHARAMWSGDVRAVLRTPSGSHPPVGEPVEERYR